MREENDSLKCQIEAYKNEMEMMKAEKVNGLSEKDSQLKILQQAMQGMQQVGGHSGVHYVMDTCFMFVCWLNIKLELKWLLMRLKEAVYVTLWHWSSLFIAATDSSQNGV